MVKQYTFIKQQKVSLRIRVIFHYKINVIVKFLIADFLQRKFNLKKSVLYVSDLFDTHIIV